MLSSRDKKLHLLLNRKLEKFNRKEFILTDPVAIPHSFKKREDIEIAAFLTATIAWGNRPAIMKSANMLMNLLDNSPYEFVVNHTDADLKNIRKFVYRTFNGDDAEFFLRRLKFIYTQKNGMYHLFLQGYSQHGQIFDSLSLFRKEFMSSNQKIHAAKHVSDVESGSACKRLNLFLRWMVRSDDAKVDFGLWSKIKMSDLMIPLDVHVANAARELGLTTRKQNDWKTVVEITNVLKRLDDMDPVKYDYALFGMGLELKDGKAI